VLTLKDIVGDWVRNNYIQRYPINLTEDVIRVYGYRSAEIKGSKIICYWWRWVPNKQTMEESTLDCADPEFFNKLKDFIEWRLRISDHEV
jgi:hypothetical protein